MTPFGDSLTYRVAPSGEKQMPLGLSNVLSNSCTDPSGASRYTPRKPNSTVSPLGVLKSGSVKYSDPSDEKTRSFGELNFFPRKAETSGIMVPSVSRRGIR